jgi:hypothetical protein
MRKFIAAFTVCFVASCFIVALLAACSTAQLQNSQATIAAVSQDVITATAAACQEVAPIAAPVAAAPAGVATPAVKSVADYALSVCTPAGTVVPGVKIDPTTAFWLGTLKAALANASAPAVKS